PIIVHEPHTYDGSGHANSLLYAKADCLLSGIRVYWLNPGRGRNRPGIPPGRLDFLGELPRPMAKDDPLTAPADFASAADRAGFERFTAHLVGLARAHLDPRFQHKVDPEDVVQSAYKSFCRRYGEGELAQQGINNLWSLLSLITLRKCADRVRYHKAE